MPNKSEDLFGDERITVTVQGGSGSPIGVFKLEQPVEKEVARQVLRLMVGKHIEFIGDIRTDRHKVARPKTYATNLTTLEKKQIDQMIMDESTFPQVAAKFGITKNYFTAATRKLKANGALK